MEAMNRETNGAASADGVARIGGADEAFIFGSTGAETN